MPGINEQPSPESVNDLFKLLRTKQPLLLPMIFVINDNPKRGKQIPPLVLLVNPSELGQDYAKKIVRENSRRGYVEFHWGDELDSLSAQGKTLGFITVSAPQNGQDRGEGSSNTRFLTIDSVRRETPSYRNFMDLLAFYHNSGTVFGAKGEVVSVSGISLIYDNAIYDGYFERFEWNETAVRPFQFEYSFVFKVQNTITNLILG